MFTPQVEHIGAGTQPTDTSALEQQDTQGPGAEQGQQGEPGEPEEHGEHGEHGEPGEPREQESTEKEKGQGIRRKKVKNYDKTTLK